MRKFRSFCLIWMIIGCLIALTGCMKTTTGAADTPQTTEADTSEFIVGDYPVKVTCPVGWYQEEPNNFDLQCWNSDDTVGMSIFCYYDSDLQEDVSRDEYFESQNQQILENRDNAHLIEDVTEKQFEDKVTSSVLYSAEKDGTQLYYYCSLISLKDSDCFMWVLFHALPSDFESNRETIDEILQTIQLTES